MLRIFVSSSAAERLASARDVLRGSPPGTRQLVVSTSGGAADDLVREVAATVPATFGIQRLSLTQLAARTALVALAADRDAPSTWLGAEAVAMRAVFDVTRDGRLRYFAPVAATPGFPRTLARTLHELRLAGLPRDALASLPPAGPDLAVLLDRFEACFARAESVDRADLFRTATRLLRGGGTTEQIRAIPPAEVVVLLDVPLDHAAEHDFVAAVIAGASTVLATVPLGDRDTIQRLAAMGGTVEESNSLQKSEGREGGLTLLRQFLFNTEAQPPHRELDGSVEFFSAPGEGRECVEMARRVLREARAGVRFDEMAILIRSPQSYFGLLEHALQRAGVPAWFDRGTRRPHPAGRAFLALLACAAERAVGRAIRGVSLPGAGAAAQSSRTDGTTPGEFGPPAGETWAASGDEAFGLSGSRSMDAADGRIRRRRETHQLRQTLTALPSWRARSARRGGGRSCSWRRRSSATTRRAGAGASPARQWRSRRKCGRRSARTAATATAPTGVAAGAGSARASPGVCVADYRRTGPVATRRHLGRVARRLRAPRATRPACAGGGAAGSCGSAADGGGGPDRTG